MKTVAQTAAVSILLVLGTSARAQTISNTTFCVPAGSDTVSNATFSGAATIGRGVAATQLLGTNYYSYVGFHNTYIARPDLDNDLDGSVDENDPDDDNDELTDSEELTGTEFSPITVTDPFEADSDGDGSSDGDESIADTNPGDAASFFRVTQVSSTSNLVTISWAARGGKSYDLLTSTNILDLSSSTTILATVVATNGLGEWLETQSACIVTNSAEKVFYFIRTTD